MDYCETFFRKFGHLNSSCIGKSSTVLFLSSPRDEFTLLYQNSVTCFCWFPAAMLVPIRRARNNSRSTDNVRTDCALDRSKFRLAGHVDRSQFNRIKSEINLRFLPFSCFSCYLSSRCVLRNFDMKSW